MTSWLRSFRVRLVLGAVLWISAGLMAAGYTLNEHFRSYMTAQFEDELRGHVDELIGLIVPDREGLPHLASPMSDPLFLGDSGYYWQIARRDGPLLRSASLHQASLTLAEDGLPDGVPLVTVGQGPNGPAYVLARSLSVPGAEPLRVAVAADRHHLDDVLERYNHSLALRLALIGLGLMAAAFAQIAFGLKPLGRERAALAAIRSGQADRLPDNLPPEVEPLATDLNALMAANQGIIRRARAQAGNLAHSLKTPLALLMDEGVRLDAAGHPSGPGIITQCQRMRRQIDYQMAQARATASRGAPGVSTRLRPALESVVSAVSRLYSDRDLAFEALGDLDLAVACDPRDLDDMLGNLLDNAGKWAASAIRISVHQPAGSDMVQIRVEDDGPGLPPEARERVFEVGERLDEQAPGTGLGLAIVRDFAELYGGNAWIDSASLGGAAACLDLPTVCQSGSAASTSKK